MKIAILGANGFVGTRIVEQWHEGPHSIRPIVRRYAALARLSRFDLDCRVVLQPDAESLAKAFEGCDAVVHCVSGDAKAIVDSSLAAYHAASQAGVRRLVYLSSASVYGQAPAEGVDESTPTSDGQWHWYNNAKVHAENGLRRERQRGSTELTILRPGIVWGPRSRWITGFVEDVMSGQAWVLNGGLGVLNSVFVDNLIHAIDLCLTAPRADGEALFVQDDEALTWRDLYVPLCRAAGASWGEVADIPLGVTAPGGERTAVDKVKSMGLTKKLAPRIAPRTKRVAKAALGAWRSPTEVSSFELPVAPVPALTQEMLLVQSSTWRLPDDKARKVLGYAAATSFEAGMRETLKWLRWAGYPVEIADLAHP